MNNVLLTTLSSGIPCVIGTTASPVSYCALSTMAGTRFEPEGLAGLAHFCEHMLFKGTVKRNAWHINNRLERLGGEINAFTTKEELVLHATVLREDLDKALELMSDLVLHSVFSKEGIAKEREVILEEIRSYKDSPTELIYDAFEEKLFCGTSMAKPILGYPRELKKIGSEHMKAFMKERFVPGNMALSIVGNTTQSRVWALAEKYFGENSISLPTEKTERPENGNSFCEPACLFEEAQKRGTYQAHCLTGSTAYGLHHKYRIPLVLLMNVMGGPASNARLHMLLREKHGLVYTVEASYQPYTDTGFAGIYFGTDAPNVTRCRELVEKVIAQYSRSRMTGLQLNRAKKQLIGQVSIAEDNHEVQCLSMGKSLLSFGKVLTHSQLVSEIESVTPLQIMEAANQIWDEKRRCTLLYH
ncbi:MAG: insulinase family protein [Bacteroidales bacterium]|nr:insulinase family protein [Bacteroidales bacterium]